MSPIVDVEMRRNRHGSVLAYSDRDRAARLLEDHRGVLTSLYELVDRRHGADGEIVAQLTIAEDRTVDAFDVRERFRRDLEADRALAIVDDVRHHAGDGQLVTDGGRNETHLSEDRGLWIPPELREFTGQIVFRTPRSTIQHFGSDLDAYYGMIDESHFGALPKIASPQNPELAPDRVSIMPQGEDAQIFEVSR